MHPWPKPCCIFWAQGNSFSWKPFWIFWIKVCKPEFRNANILTTSWSLVALPFSSGRSSWAWFHVASIRSRGMLSTFPFFFFSLFNFTSTIPYSVIYATFGKPENVIFRWSEKAMTSHWLVGEHNSLSWNRLVLMLKK